MKKIRIGNDLRFAIDLRQYVNPGQYLAEREVYTGSQPDFESIDSNEFVNKKYEVYYPYGIYGSTSSSGDSIDFQPSANPICIRSVKAYVINTSKEKERAQRDKKPKFISRFPIEPYVNAFDSNAYDICCSGHPTYHCYPYPHRIVPYGGFGVHPCWEGIYKKFHKHDDLRYCAQVYATNKQNVVELSFPAYAQKYTGVYKIVVIAKVFAPGYNPENLKTITIDVPDVFELVDTTQEGVDTGIRMNVQMAVDALPSGEDSNVSYEYDDLHMDNAVLGDNNIITFELNDRQTRIPLDISEQSGWYNDERE